MIGIFEYTDGIETRFAVCLSGDMSAVDVRDTLRYAARAKRDSEITDFERRARRFLQNAGHDPDRPGDLKGPVEQMLKYAHEVLRRIRIFRSAKANGDYEGAIDQAVAIEALASRYDFFIDYGSFIMRGRAFVKGPKQNRQDALARTITESLAKLGPAAPAKKVLKWLRNNTNFDIDEDGTVFWTSDGGRNKSTSFKSLENRLVFLRRRAPEN